MSRYKQFNVKCGCDREFDVSLAVSANSARNDSLKGKVLDKKLNEVCCPCGQSMGTPSMPMYFQDCGTDKPTGYLVINSCHEADSDTPERIRQAVSKELKKHTFESDTKVVFGMTELREHLLCSESSLNHQVSEIGKVLAVLSERSRVDGKVAIADVELDEVKEGKLHYSVIKEEGERSLITVPISILESISKMHGLKEQTAENASESGDYVRVKKLLRRNKKNLDKPSIKAIEEIKVPDGHWETNDVIAEMNRVSSELGISLEVDWFHEEFQPWLLVLIEALSRVPAADLAGSSIDKILIDEQKLLNGSSGYDSIEGAGGESFDSVYMGLNAFNKGDSHFMLHVLHEVGHSVEEKLRRSKGDAYVNAEFYEMFGWQMISPYDDREFSEWINRLGGVNDLTDIQIKEVKAVLHLCCGPIESGREHLFSDKERFGENWLGARLEMWKKMLQENQTIFEEQRVQESYRYVLANRDSVSNILKLFRGEKSKLAGRSLIWTNKEFGPRNVCEKTFEQWYEKYDHWYSKDRIKFALNFTYGKFMSVSEAKVESLRSKMASYAMMSKYEFFAELYATYYIPNSPIIGEERKAVQNWFARLLTDI